MTRKQLRAAEYVLFLGLTLLLMASQYFVGLDLMDRSPDYRPIILAFIKDGVIQMLVLMMIYGTLVPNPPAVAARALAAMFLGPVAGLSCSIAPRRRPILAWLGQAEEPAPTSCSWPSARRWRSTARSSSTACGPAAQGPQVRPVSTPAQAGRGGHGRGLPRRAPAPEAPAP